VPIDGGLESVARRDGDAIHSDPGRMMMRAIRSAMRFALPVGDSG
jgi:hypothetical protein